MSQNFGEETLAFVRRIEAIALVYPDVLGRIERHHERAAKAVANMIQEGKFDVKQDAEEDSLQVTVPVEKLVPFSELARRSDRMALAATVVAQSFIVTLVSQYDIFLGDLIRSIYQAKPEILSGSERQINYTQLIQFGSINDATNYIIDNEVESVLRESHAEQIKWFENKLGIPLTKDLEIWPRFIEVTERRNLFVHCGGIVSRQYLDVCMKHNVTHEQGVNIGDQLKVTPQYLQDGYKCIFQMGVMLGQVVWRKLIPADSEAADNVLTLICLDLMVRGLHDIAKVLLEFGLMPVMKHSGRNTIIFQINLAQSQKWLGDEDACKATLAKIDWSTQRDEFLLCKVVLEDDFEMAASYIRRFGKADPPIPPHAYVSWPIFREFRKSEVFAAAFAEVFGTDYEFDEKRDVDLLNLPPPSAAPDDPTAEP